MQSSTDVRKAAESRWNEFLRTRKPLFNDNLVGFTPPSVFVGSFGYPRLSVGPMVTADDDSSLSDYPEKWAGLKLKDIIRYRMNLVRGVKHLRVQESSGRYIESLQDVTMSSSSTDAQMIFEKPPTISSALDGQSAPFGPVGEIKSAKFSAGSSEKKIERIYYDHDLNTVDGITDLYNTGVKISTIQKCLSIGMIGKKRKLVPTKWSITATDDIISKWLVNQILEESQIDSFEVYFFEHLGNLFSILLFPHRWMYEMIEAWYSGNVLGFGSDHEDARGINHAPAIAGAYHAAKLAVAEHLYTRKLQAGVLILREIRPEYSIPVGVWQVREGVRSAMMRKPIIYDDLQNAINGACSFMSISKNEWLTHGKFTRLLLQKTLSEYM